jgi:hypothetical protein
MTGLIADLQVSSTSKQYVSVPVAEVLTGGNPTGDSVALSFPAVGVEPTAFVAGQWVTEGGVYFAQALVGPGTSAVLAAGFYDVYVKVTDSPEVPVLRSGLLEVT